MGMERIFAAMALLPMFEQGKAAQERDVAEIERLLGFQLSDEYRAFLLRFGHVSWFGIEIFGFGEGMNSCVRSTSIERSQLGTRMPEKSVVISIDDMGGSFLLVSRDDPAYGEVLWVNPHEPPVILKRWNSFSEYLEYRIKTSVEQ